MYYYSFDTYLESTDVIRYNSLKKDDTHQSQIITLKELVSSCNYLLIYVLNGSTTPPNSAFLQALQQFILSKDKQLVRQGSENSSPGKLKRIFGISKKSTENIGSVVPALREVNVLVIDLEFTPNEQILTFIKKFDFYSVPSHYYLTKSRLLRALNFAHAPSLFIVDCADSRRIIQAYREILDNPEGNQFHWSFPTKMELFNTTFLRNSLDGSGTLQTVDFTILQKGMKGLFFGAKWCPPSRHLSKQLCEIYPKLKTRYKSFEIIFCSSDRSEQSFIEYFSTMPWLALPFNTENKLSKAYDVQRIPTFLLLDEDFNVISRNGYNLILSDPDTPLWEQKTVYELTEKTVHRLSEIPSLILFTEGSPEDAEFSFQFLTSFIELINPCQGDQSNSLESSSDFEHFRRYHDLQLQVFYTGEDPICDYILESLGQEHADLPLLLICDIMAGYLAICDKPDVSEKVLLEFVADYRAGRANIFPIPSSKSKQNTPVPGIPTDVIEKLIEPE